MKNNIKVRCICGWEGPQDDLIDKQCPECQKNFVSYPPTPRDQLVDLHEETILSVADSPHRLWQALDKINIRRAFNGREKQDMPYNLGRDIEHLAKELGVKVNFVITEREND